MNFVTLHEARKLISEAHENLRNWLAGYICRIFVRGRIYSVSTADSGAKNLVDRVTGFPSTQSGQKSSNTEAGRLEYAGHLVIPRLNEPAQQFGDGNNCVYLPVASTKYRPSGGQPGDSAQYNLTDENDQRATIWTRESGKVEIDSGTAASQDVVVNHGTHKIARVADQGDPGRLRSFVTPPDPMTGSVVLTVDYVEPVSPDGGPPPTITNLLVLRLPASVTVLTPAGPAFPVNIQMLNYNTTGADHFKG